MDLISSAQNQEDIMLWRALRQVENGFYIDVGAADPLALSVTRLFYERGWRGINLEPNPDYFELLQRERPRDVNLAAGAGAQSGAMTLHVIAGSGLSTFDAGIAARHAADAWPVTERLTEIMTLAEICRAHRPTGAIHFLKIDVEGFEGEVLAGADFRTFRPWIVLAEATLPMSQQESHAAWEPILTGQGYSFVWFDGLNRFYLADEKRAELGHCFRVQPNVFDGFAGAAELARRAEAAERSLAQLRAESARRFGEFETQTRRADAILRQTLEALTHQSALTAQVQAHCNSLLAAAVQAQAREAQADAQARAELAGAHARAEIAEAWRRSMAASTSWRITAPMRMAARLLGSPAGRTLKDIVRFAHRLAPAPVEFLARRHPADDGRSAPAETPPPADTPPAPVFAENERAAALPQADAGLSAAELRIYRQIAGAAAAPALSN